MYFTVYGLWHRSGRDFGGCSCVGYCVSLVEFAILSDWCLLALMWSMDIHVVTVDVPWWLHYDYKNFIDRMMEVVIERFLTKSYFLYLCVVSSSSWYTMLVVHAIGRPISLLRKPIRQKRIGTVVHIEFNWIDSWECGRSIGYVQALHWNTSSGLGLFCWQS